MHDYFKKIKERFEQPDQHDEGSSTNHIGKNDSEVSACEDIGFVFPWEEENPTDFKLKEKEIYERLLSLLEEEKVFLNRVSLAGISAKIATNTTYLSNVVNRYFNCNFKTLINRYRIEYSKQLLTDITGNVLVKEIPCQCGFSSSSAFYDSFGKVVGVSPVEFRIMSMNESKKKGEPRHETMKHKTEETIFEEQKKENHSSIHLLILFYRT